MRSASLELPVFSFYVGNRSYSLSENPLLPSRRNTQFDFIRATRVPLVILDLEHDKGRFYLSRTAQNFLNSLKGECYIISVSGRPVIGKSSLLNLLLSIFDWKDSNGEVSYQDIYTVGDENIESTTEGIDMYCLHVNGQNYIFLDVEGDNDSGRGEIGTWVYTNLIQTALGVSHLHLYNYNGVSQQSLLTYFETITKVVRQFDTPEDFETKYIFLRRDFSIRDREVRLQKLQSATTSLKNKADLNLSLHFVPTAPEHILQKNSQTSCIASTGALCQGCRTHEFTSILLEIREELKQHTRKAAPFQSGRHLCRALEQQIEINSREIPFFLDLGCIKAIRLKRINNEKERIKDGLEKVERYQGQDSLYQEVLRIVTDHPSLTKMEEGQNFHGTKKLEGRRNTNEAGDLEESKNSSEPSRLEESKNSNEAENLANNQLINDFEDVGEELINKVSQMEYLIIELSTFIDQYLLNDRISILSEEKTALLEAYVDPFNKTLSEVIILLRKYDQIIDRIYQKLLNIKTNITTHLKEYLKIASESRNRTLTIGAHLLSTAGLGFLGREVAAKLLFWVCGVGGGAIGIFLTVFFFVRAFRDLEGAIKKNNEILDRDNKNGIKEITGSAKEMKKFVTELIENFEKSRENLLKKVCLEDHSEHTDLIAKIKEAMDVKIRRGNPSVEIRDQLIEKLGTVENNLEMFKQCL